MKTPLHEMAFNGLLAKAKEMIERGCPVDISDEVTLSVVLTRFQLGMVIDFTMALPKFTQTPLLLASKQGHEDMIELLIEKGADVNHKNQV